MDKNKSINILNSVLEYLNMNAKQLSEAIGKERPQWAYDVLNPKKKVGISKDITERICTTFPKFNKAWLLTGEGDMLNEPKEEASFIKSDILYAPLISQYAHAGYLAGYADKEYMDTLPMIPWIEDTERKGNYISFEVRGDSMDDGLKHSYEQGDILLCREINKEYWRSKLHFNQWDAFVIVHRLDGIVVKQIVDHDVEKGVITVHSFNPMYEDYQIDLRDVAQLFNVVKQQKNK